MSFTLLAYQKPKLLQISFIYPKRINRITFYHSQIQMTSYSLKLILTSLAFLALYFINFPIESSNLLQQNLHQSLDCGLSSDFLDFLNDKGYGSYQYNRTDIKCGSYGGKKSPSEKVAKIPIIFIHGNSDVAFGRGTLDSYAQWQTGFRSLAAYFTAQGYKKGELYTTTYGAANPDTAKTIYHCKQNLIYVRKFVEAVIEYTKAPKVVIIGHSMGVTIGRKIIKGGNVTDHKQGNYSLGPSLRDKVKLFVGIAGANLGLASCYGVSMDVYPTCNKYDGFYPGLLASSSPSVYLNDLNVVGGPQGQKIYTIWSKYDNLIGDECMVWGKITCRIPGQTGQIIKTQKIWNHFALRDNTGQDILHLI